MTINPPPSNSPLTLWYPLSAPRFLSQTNSKAETMEEFGSFWSHQENMDDLKQKLLYTSFELESVKMEASEEIRKNKEHMKDLLTLLKIACQERDEARNQLQKLINKIMASTNTELRSLPPQIQPESSFMVPSKANSSITESNSLSETYNPHSHGSSPADSFFDGVTSPELSSINMADSGNLSGFVNQTLVSEFTNSVPSGLAPSRTVEIDPASLVIDNFVRGKPLPQKGKLLQAVMESGPLLQTLLVSGPLPRWRNPPPLQSFKLPAISMKDHQTRNSNQNPETQSSFALQKPAISSPYLEISRGSSQVCSASLMNFSAGPSSGSCFNNAFLVGQSSRIKSEITACKRQRLQ